MPSCVAEKPLAGVAGWLLFLCISLVFVGPIAIALKYLEWLPAARWSVIPTDIRMYIGLSFVVDFLLAAFGALAGTALWRRHPLALAVTKVFLVIRPILVCGKWIAERQLLAPANPPVYPVLASVVASAVWFAYLEKSERVATPSNQIITTGEDNFRDSRIEQRWVF